MFTKKSPILVTQNIINAIAGYIGLFFITRYVGITIWGFVAFGMGFTGIFSLATELGFSSAYTKSISEGKDVEEATNTFFAVKLVLAVIFVILALSALFFWTDVLHRGFQNPVEFWVIIALIPYYFFGTLLSIPKSYYSSTFSSYRQVLPSIVEAISRNGLFVAIGVIYEYRLFRFPDADLAIVIGSVYSITYTVYYIYMMYLGRPWHLGRPNKEMLKYFAIIALPLAASSGISTINGNIDKIIVQFYWHADATSALYTSQIIGTSLISFSGAISGFFVPVLSRKEKSKDIMYEAPDLERFISLFILPFVIALSVFSVYFLNIFSAGYRPYYLILVFVALGNYIGIITGPYVSQIIASGKTWNIAKITTPSIIANIALNFIFVPPSLFGYTHLSMGYTGTAFASLIVAIGDYIVYKYIYSKNVMHIGYRILRQAIPSFAEILYGYILLMYIHPYSFFVLLLVSLAAVFIFFGISIAIGEITKDEFVEFLTNLNPLLIPKRVKEEREADLRNKGEK
ncbi:O-antigen transporter [Thermoplasma volcanium GSS1]|uniref:O-antigen transporter n=1 Tax=Thermoplasma volcanium (strain ATCC 51530 / DSM 4299 / JCM 9571 / NBRC 15438 / GSS1) TaxID=273116 RepID=Q97B06_THEVO|nr:oligosaccharide flippase family protein [Thermoplasma volcanium]BAB59795.1 O-antigen transporter [Thermoplasma volcanium GSS1]